MVTLEPGNTCVLRVPLGWHYTLTTGTNPFDILTAEPTQPRQTQPTRTNVVIADS